MSEKNQDLMSKTCQSFSLPLYALIHDSIVQALNSTNVPQKMAASIMQALPKLPLNSNEYDELKSAKGAIELEDTFGSGSFYVVEAGSKQAYVVTQQNHADFVNRLVENRDGQNGQNGQDNQKAQGGQGEQNKNGNQNDQPQNQQNQVQSVQDQAAGKVQNQNQGTQSGGQDLLQQMLMLQALSGQQGQQGQQASGGQGQQAQNKGQGQGQGQMQQKLLELMAVNQGQQDPKMLQKLALIELMQGENQLDNMLKDYQKLMILKQLTQNGQTQGQNQNQNQNQNQGQGQSQVQSQGQGQGQGGQQANQQQQVDLLQLIQQLQMMKTLQGQK